MQNEPLQFHFVTLTSLWTGDYKGKNGVLRFTDIKGSFRWWYEALIRGLGAYACDPVKGGCLLDMNKISKNIEIIPQVKEQICPVCLLFGCTGWAGKFIFKIKDAEGRMRHNQLQSNDYFTLELLPVKQLENTEKLLIQMTLKLIVDYGAVGGKTVLKPSEKDHKNTKFYRNAMGASGHHFDYGILTRKIENNENKSNLSGIDEPIYVPNKKIVDDYSYTIAGKNNDPLWPDLRCFWFIRDYTINKDIHNAIVKRDPNNPKRYLNTTSPGDVFHWLGGDSNIHDSKKIFSFHGIKQDASISLNGSAKNTDKISGIARCFGYSKTTEFDDVVRCIEQNIHAFAKILYGSEVLNGL